MKDVREIAKLIFEKGYLMSLGTVDEGGVWVSDLIYVNDENFNIYWLSRVDTRHSKAIMQNPKVACAITVNNDKEGQDMGLQIEGIVEKIEGDILEIATKHRLKRGKPVPKNLGEILDPGESWYKLKPTKIEVIYQPLFGYNKQTLEL